MREVYQLKNGEWGVRETGGGLIQDLGFSCYTKEQAEKYKADIDSISGGSESKKVVLCGKRINGKTTVNIGDIKI